MRAHALSLLILALALAHALAAAPLAAAQGAEGEQRGAIEARIGPTLQEASPGALATFSIAVEGATPGASLGLLFETGVRAVAEVPMRTADAAGRAQWNVTLAAPPEGHIALLADVVDGATRAHLATVSARLTAGEPGAWRAGVGAGNVSVSVAPLDADLGVAAIGEGVARNDANATVLVTLERIEAQGAEGRVGQESFLLVPGAQRAFSFTLTPQRTDAQAFLVTRVEGAAAAGTVRTPIELRLHAPAPPAPVESEATMAPALAAAALGVGLAAAGAVVIARRETWRLAFVGALLPLFTRLAPSKLLEHRVREEIHERIAREPGIGFAELQRATGLPTGALIHHLRALERGQLVTSRKEGARRRFYPPGGARPAATATSVATSFVALTPAQAKLLRLLAERPLTQGEIAERLGVSQQAASKQVKALERAGLLAQEMDASGRRVVRPLQAPVFN